MNATKPPTAKERRNPQRASAITPTKVKWLWTPYIARRKLTLLDGDPGSGKSNICLDLTARISTGDTFPGHTLGTARDGRTVLYFTQEDDLDDTVVPRLILAGAALDNVILDDGPLNLSEAADKAALRAMVRTERPALIVFDTLAGYIGGTTDLFRENSVRPVLLNLAMLAREFDTSVIALRHLVKGEKSKALYLGQGSMAMVGVARSVMLAAEDPNDSKRRALFHVKNNLGPKADPLGYVFGEGGRLEWDADTDLTIGDIMKAQGVGHAPGKGKEAQAVDILIEMLADSAVDAKTMAQVMNSHGIAPRTWKRAKKTVGVNSYQEGGSWYWALPHEDIQKLIDRVTKGAA